MKRFSLLFFLLVNIVFGYSQTSQEYIDSILKDTKDISQTELRERYVKAAKIKETLGELSEAVDFYKKASLVVNGQKDFESLYKASVLNTEMALYDQAETDLKIILMFSEDKKLRMRATILESRISFLKQDYTDSVNILKSVLTSGEDLSFEGLLWVDELLKRTKNLDVDTKEITQFYEKQGLKDIISKASNLLAFSTPENVFLTTKTEIDKEIETEQLVSDKTDDNDESEIASGIQVGSFSVKENAEELKIALEKEKFDVQTKEKIIGGKTYFSVIVEVKDGEDLQRKMIGLKEKGYEGYPVY